MTLKRGSVNSVSLSCEKKKGKKQNNVSKVLYFWCSIVLGGGTSGFFSWCGGICHLAMHVCSSTVPQQHFLQRLVNKWPNPNRGWVNLLSHQLLTLLCFSGCPRWVNSAAFITQVQSLYAGGVWSAARMRLKEAQLLLQGLTTT